MQSTLGAHNALLDQVSDMGIHGWLDRELNQRPSEGEQYLPLTRKIWQHFRSRLIERHGEGAINGDGNNPALPYKWYFHMAWWHHALSGDEHLVRKRVAQALSELLVISDQSVLELDALGMADYYDLLYTHAFGYYDELLEAVSLHPCMGVYLSHMNNRKADPAQHIHPDENYAREIMQLFTIGLVELDADGREKQDSQGLPIPTYDNRDIKELARVFTGIRAASYKHEWTNSFWESSYNGYPVGFSDGVPKAHKTIPFVDMTRPMQVEEAFHDRGPKRLLKGRIRLPGKQKGATEIRAVVRALVAHPNTAPFVARHLIRQLVTSNPSPDYVAAAAGKFGPRGDLKAMVREILTYPLAHPGENYRKLKSPLLRVTQLLRAFKAHNESGRLWLIGDDIQEALGQHPLSAPTVFNFYSPDFVPPGPLENHNLTAPEFQLHGDDTAIAYVNTLYQWFFGEFYPAVSTRISDQEPNVAELDPERLQEITEDRLRLDFSELTALAQRPGNHGELVDRVCRLLTGKRRPALKKRILDTVRDYRDRPDWVIQTLLFMVAVSGDFTVLEGDNG